MGQVIREIVGWKPNKRRPCIIGRPRHNGHRMTELKKTLNPPGVRDGETWTRKNGKA